MKFTIVFGLVTIFTIRVMRHKNMVKIGVAPLQNKSIYAYKNFGSSKLLASGDNRHSGSGEKRQFWSTENSHLQFE